MAGSVRPKRIGALSTVWMDDALCLQIGPDMFMPEGQGGSAREPKRVCLQCDVRAACLDYALAIDERGGVWGGMSERERRKEKRQRAEAAAKAAEQEQQKGDEAA